MTAGRFVRWFAVYHTRGQLVTVAGTEAAGTITWAVIPAAAGGLTGWAAVAAGAAGAVLFQVLAWWLLGLRHVQRWIRDG